MIESYTLAEASDLLGKSSETVRRWAMAGELEYTCSDTQNNFRVSKSDIDALLAAKPGTDYIAMKEACSLLGLTSEGANKATKRHKCRRIKWCKNQYVHRDDVLGIAASGYTPAPSHSIEPPAPKARVIQSPEPPYGITTQRQWDALYMMARVDDIRIRHGMEVA